ncbi:MAG TPA: hypothetical protein VFV38_27840 [Ktedonobacteraceae bacterium]|nr:hypothetical protein [Ktedonobacteraceae bacterium]
MSTFKADLLIKDNEGKPIAVIEVQSRHNLSSDVATEIRRTLLEHGLPAQIPYFLLLSQDDGYLWKGSVQLMPDSPPMYHFPMNSVIHRYSLKEPDQRLFASELELLMLHWLANLSMKQPETPEEPEKTLAQAGFNESIKNGMVLIEEGI